MRRLWIAALAAVPAFCASQIAASAAPLQESDVRRIVAVSSPAISPDGKRAVVIVSRVDWDDDKRKSEIVAIDLPGGAQRILTYDRTGLADPTFSPDGSSLAFIADAGTGDDAKSQVFVMPFDGGDARAVTAAKDGVEQFAWRPDGGAIVYAAADPKPERKGADRFRDSFVFTTQPITTREPERPVHLFLVSLHGGAAEQLTTGEQTVVTGEAASTISWSPDGKKIAFAVAPDAILNDETYSHVVLLDVATKTLRPLTSHAAWESQPEFSPDGKHVAYLYSKGDGQVNLVRLYVTTPAGGDGTAVAFDRPVDDYAWARDSQSLLMVAPDRTSTALFAAKPGGVAARVDLGALSIASGLAGAVGPNASLAFVASSTKVAPELYYRSASYPVSKLTSYNAALGGLDLAASEALTFATTLGIDGDAVLYTPPGFTPGKKYPLVVFIHGGPTSASTQAFDFYAQVMAARGWLVLRPNYRGSDNLGLAYQRAVLYDPDEGPGKDIMAAVDAVRARGIVDDRKMAVCGWSYGGIMTAWMISKYHVWAAAVSGASVNDWATDYGVADDSLSDAALFHGSPYVPGNFDEWRKASAIAYAADVTTPVLILSDVGDNRDPFATSSMYWRALRDNKKDATLRVWPVDGHFPHDPVRSADVYHYWIDFIAKHFGE